MTLSPVADGDLAAVVTSLEMTAPPRPAPLPAVPFRLEHWREPALDRYRTLFRRVGAPWLWYSRLVMTDEALAAILGDPAVAVHAVVDPRGIELGLVELDHRAEGACQISYFALVPELAGRGLGRWLMQRTLALAWRPGVRRVWLHTCTLDHPSALGFYKAQGFVPFARAVEIFSDPRHAGVLPRDAAPHVPLLAPDTRR